MKLRSGGFLTRSAVGMLMAFLASWVLTPTEVHAGCSAHYLTSRSSLSTAPRLDSLLTGDFRSQSPGDMPQPRPVPCTGAFCSGNPATPLSTTPSLPPGSAGDWALSLRLAAPGETGCHQRLPAGDDFRPVDQPSSIFHPPRSLA